MPLAALLQARPSAPSRRRGGTRTQTPAQRRVLLAYIGLNAALDVVWLLTFGRSHPGLVRERLRPGPGAKEGFLKIFVLYGLPYLGHYVLAALDLGRCHWFRPVPLRLQLAGLIGYFGALGVAMWATAVNPFFSSAVRIQSERGQHVNPAASGDIAPTVGELGGQTQPVTFLFFPRDAGVDHRRSKGRRVRRTPHAPGGPGLRGPSTAGCRGELV